MILPAFFRSRWLALGWLIFISVLFFLPGSALPSAGWLSAIYFDKWVHAGFFAVLFFLWRSAFDKYAFNITGLLWLAIAIYALLIEVIQKEWIPNRSFDVYDIIADITGSGIGWLIWRSLYKKNRPL